MWAPPNWPEGRVSSTSAPACCCARDVLGQQAIRHGKIGERRGAGAIELGVLREISGTLGKFAGEQVHEFFARFRLEREVGDALLADGGTALGTHLAAAQRAGAVRGIDLHRVGQGEELGVQAVVEQAGELLRRVIGREVGTSHVADEQGVAGEDGPGLGRAFGIGYQDRDALRRVAGRFQEAQDAVAKADFVAIAHRDVRKFRAGLARRGRSSRR